MKLKQDGYTHALRFDSNYHKNVDKIERWLTERFGSKWAMGSEWYGTLGTPRYKDGYYSRPYYIGFKTKEMATMVLLAMS